MDFNAIKDMLRFSGALFPESGQKIFQDDCNEDMKCVNEIFQWVRQDLQSLHWP